MTAQARDLIMWVGSGPYPTWRGFADEAARMGVCKRVRAVPRGLVMGQSKCYLLHGERIATKGPIHAHMFRKRTGICRFCGISRDGYSQNLTECSERMVRRAGKPCSFMYGYFVIEQVLKADEHTLMATPDRMCGKLKEGGIYLVGPLTEYPEPKPWSGDTFVGFRYYTEVS